MAITFNAELINADVRRFEVRCDAQGVITTTPLPQRQAHALASSHIGTCTDWLCAEYGADVDEVDGAPLVNLHDVNGVAALRVLGYLSEYGADDVYEGTPEDASLDLSGCDNAAAFRGRVETALALSPEDEGMLAYTVVGRTNVHVGARRPGALQQNLLALRTLAIWCEQYTYDVVWG